jgi:hypothetical protein
VCLYSLCLTLVYVGNGRRVPGRRFEHALEGSLRQYFYGRADSKRDDFERAGGLPGRDDGEEKPIEDMRLEDRNAAFGWSARRLRFLGWVSKERKRLHQKVRRSRLVLAGLKGSHSSPSAL